jgi:signal transduction histidine kinase
MLQKSKELDNMLIQSQKLAAIGELSTGIAHEINNPLAVMTQEIEWMEYLISGQGAMTQGKLKEIVDGINEIRNQINRCKDVTHRLLALARKTDLVFQETNINQIVEDMAALVEKEARVKNISVLKILNKSLPQVKTDPPLLRQVLLNLLNNAMCAIGTNGRIILRTDTDGPLLTISVEDNGQGIPNELLPRIFDPFFTTKEPGKGTGLGLTISQNIVHRLGGRIEVHSKVGEGTTFKVYLPMEVRDGRES